MPLEPGDLGDLKEKPLPGSIFEARFNDTKLHSTAGMNQKLGKLCFAAGPDFSPHALAEIDDPWPYNESPTEIT
jgi:hypothetical protein